MEEKAYAQKPLQPSPLNGVYVARQPIFDVKEELYGYELLFRSGFNNIYDSSDGDYATGKTILNSFIMLGLDPLTGGKLAFINFTKNLLLNEVATIFPRELLAVEVLENIEPDESVIEACKKMKKAGYLIVLDDFVFMPKFQPLIEIADIIKVDFRISNSDAIHSLLSRLSSSKIRFLAEKVETKEEFIMAKEVGFAYFQGYFFSKPHIISGREVPGYKLNYMQILREMNKAEADFDVLEHIIKRDMSLTYALLKFINSAFFGFSAKIQSIKQAITLLGMNEFKKWVSLIALTGMGNDKPEELMVNSLIRAKFCEFMARKTNMKDKSSDLFLMGMFSMIDAFIDRPMQEILGELPLSTPVKEALMGKENQFRDILDLVIAYEKGNWLIWGNYIKKLKLEESEFPDIYMSSIDWARKIFRE